TLLQASPNGPEHSTTDLSAGKQAAQGHAWLLRARRERPRRRRAAECSQQFPPSDGDCHTPLPCEVRKSNDTTSRACSLHVQGGRMLVASPLVVGLNQLLLRRRQPVWGLDCAAVDWPPGLRTDLARFPRS